MINRKRRKFRFAPGGHSSFCSFVNSFVHVVMYSYYGLAAIGPSMAPYIWWKKYITKLQLTQFIIVFTHCFQLLFRECDYPRIFMSYIGFYSVLFLFMFSDFYVKAYRKSLADAKSALSAKSMISESESKSDVGNLSNGSSSSSKLSQNIVPLETVHQNHSLESSKVPQKSLNQVIKKLM